MLSTMMGLVGASTKSGYHAVRAFEKIEIKARMNVCYLILDEEKNLSTLEAF